MDQLLKGILCLANLILIAGIVGASLGQADRAFDLGFWLRTWQQASQPPNADLAQFVSNSRCTPNPQATSITPAQLQTLQTQLHQNSLTSLEHVQQQLGIPLCHTDTAQGKVLAYTLSDHGHLFISHTGNKVTLQWQRAF